MNSSDEKKRENYTRMLKYVQVRLKQMKQTLSELDRIDNIISEQSIQIEDQTKETPVTVNIAAHIKLIEQKVMTLEGDVKVNAMLFSYYKQRLDLIIEDENHVNEK